MKFMKKGSVYGYPDVPRKFLVLSDPFTHKDTYEHKSFIMWMDTREIEATHANLSDDEEERFI